MKFAKVFEQALKDELLPEEWLNTAIQYKLLKKCIGRVVDELENIGLDKETLSVLLEEEAQKNGEDVYASYGFEKVKNDVDPKLVITVKKNDTAQQHLPELVMTTIGRYLDTSSETEENVLVVGPKIIQVTENAEEDTLVVEINMSLDSVFFHMLYQELQALDDLKQDQENKMIADVSAVGRMVSELSTPSRRKSDMYVWREIFRSYIDSEIFFSTSEVKAGERNADESRERFLLFMKRLTDQEIVKKFRHKRSAEAFNSFYNINLQLLKALQFQSYNKLAITKILKKFDKQTSLTAKSKFPELIQNDPFITLSFSHTICAIIASRLLNIVPQLEDYTCPICCSVAFKPIRLNCGHVFCVRCLVKMQRRNQDHCPLCRADAVMNADEGNLDMARLKYLQLYFPKETKEKQLETEREIAKEQFELMYGGEQKCCIQ